MIYPRFVKKGDIIGITAPSDGNRKETDFIRLDNGKKQLINKGFRIIETAHVRSSNKGRSTDGTTRAKEFEELIVNEKVKWIISAKGGDFLVEMLSHLDFNNIKAHPKWFQGYSDNTGITFSVTTNCDIATIYGCNFNDFGMEHWHKSLENNINLITGDNVIQHSFTSYEDGFYDRITGLEDYKEDKPVYWKNITSNDEITITGRLIGGCLDVLLNLVGTKFDNTINFINQYKEDGILWYLESFSLNCEALTRGLWQLREAGWFQNAKGFIFGRPAFFDIESYISYEEAVMSILGDQKVPIILDADIGHKAPQMTMVNGAIATVTCGDGKGKFVFEYR